MEERGESEWASWGDWRG